MLKQKLIPLFHLPLFTLVFVVLSLGKIQGASAEWTEDAQQWGISFSQNPKFTNGNLASLWGAVQAAKGSFSMTQASEVKFLSPYFGKSGAPVLLSVRSGTFGKKHRRPLVVLLPGIFSDHDSGRSKRILNRLIHQGYHAAALPNPMAARWLEAGFKYRPGDLNREAEACLNLIAGIVTYIGQDSISELHLVGESYGAFLSAVVAQKDSRSRSPFFTHPSSTVTLIGPPIQFNKTVAKVDGLIRSTLPQYLSDCSGGWTASGILLDLSRATSQRLVDSSTTRCADALFAHRGFRERAIEAATVVNKTHNLGLPVNDESWKNGLTMKGLLDLTSPAGLQILTSSRLADLGYWLSSAREQSGAQIRVLTAKDDFLNSPQQWKENGFFSFNFRRLLSLAWGGHLGYEPMDEFEDLISRAWPEASR